MMRLKISLLSLLLGCSLFGSEHGLPADENFQVETLVSGLMDTMELAVTGDGKVFMIERTGRIKLYDPVSKKTVQVAALDVAVRDKTRKFDNETGLLGIALHPDFTKNQWLYVYYSPAGMSHSQLVRFTFDGSGLKDEKVMLKIPRDRGNSICHEGGSVEFGPDGLLYLATGDNTNPFVSNGFAPIDEREGRKFADAQRTSANTNDLRGKIIRIKPTDDGGYEIPEGNLFPKGMAKTKPEIYVMGCRNPYRFTVDSKLNILYWAQVGPDASKKTERGPSGYDEINQAKKAGNYGWPYFSGANEAYADYDFKTKALGKVFDPLKPMNFSVNNTGLEQLPPAQPAFKTMRHSCTCVGPVYYSSAFSKSKNAFPESMDSSMFTYDWNNGRFMIIKLDDKGNKLWEEPIFKKHRFAHPFDIEFSPDGDLYVLEYGSGWYDNKNGTLKRIRYSKKAVAIDTKKLDPRIAGLPAGAPGTKMISESSCLACHMSNKKSIGPSYFEVAKKYSARKDAAEYLARKIISGGHGVWGDQPMPPHPQHNIEQTQQMAEAILKTKDMKEKAE